MIWDLLSRYWPDLVRGTWVTVHLTVLSMILGTVLALPVALARLGRNRLLSRCAYLYVYYFRGTPLLVQIFLIYYGLPQLGWTLEAYPSAIIALSLNTAAYTSEVIRGGILAVAPGEIEAGRAMGMSGFQVFRRIVLPQCVGYALPAYLNEIILQIKATSLASTITVMELTGVSRTIAAKTYMPWEVYIAAGTIYLIIVLGLSRVMRMIESRVTAYRLA